MIHFFLNGLAASAGGGITYLRNVVPELSSRPDVRATVAVSRESRPFLQGSQTVELLNVDGPNAVASRFIFEQRQLPALIRDSGANVVVSAGNFALWKCPVPQILLSRNALYTSRDFLRDLRRRRDLKLWLDTKIKGTVAGASIRHADVTVAPSHAFAEDLERWTGIPVRTIYHGFSADRFHGSKEALPASLAESLANPSGALRLLFVSHYNYYRNFETLFRAIPAIKKLLAPRPVELLLTCRLRSEQNPGSYQADSAASVVQELGIAENVRELGSVPYQLLLHVYKSCDIYVTPAYAESFAHPLVEAMSSGLPVVASDLAVHREICGQAGVYFSRFSSDDLARQVASLASDSAAAKEMARLGLLRSLDFSWKRHVTELLELANRMVRSQ
jgi:glycosyltransferase involved in cell wall biosynthesis